MPKVKISEYSATANSNTDVASINIDEGCAPSGINNAIRAVMGHLKDFQQGTNGDPFNGPVNGTLGATTASTAVVTTLNSTDATDASSTTAAAMKTAGGLGVAKKMFVGLDANIYGLTVGRGAGAVATNTAVGASALAGNSTGVNATAVGYQALNAHTGGYATAVGSLAGKLFTLNASESFGSTFVGVLSGQAATTGYDNAFFGAYSGWGTTTGSFNTATGAGALKSNTTASKSVAVGYQAGYTTYNGDGQTLVGYQAGYALTNGSYVSTFIGYQAGIAMTSGNRNTIIGSFSGNQGGLDIRTASNYVVLSDGDGNPRGIFDGSGNLLLAKTSFSGVSGTGTIVGTDGRINVVNAATTNAFSTYELYSTGVSGYRFYVGAAGTVFATNTTITAISDQRLKENIRDLDDGLDVVMALKPRKFDWKEGKGVGIKNARGFIAQEFEQVLPDMIEEWKDPAPEGEEAYKAINANLIPTLVKAIQELKAEVDSLKAQINGA